MNVYHGTSYKAANAIEKAGFQDSTGTYLTANEYTGVWVADCLLGASELDYEPDVYFEISVADETALADFEWIEDGKGYREWLVPAALLNTYRWRRLTADEADRLRYGE